MRKTKTNSIKNIIESHYTSLRSGTVAHQPTASSALCKCFTHLCPRLAQASKSAWLSLRSGAFTMAEAIIVMTILGIIATIMITNLKPSEFRDKGLQVMAKKVLQQLDTATQQIMINNTQNGKLTTIYSPDKSTTYSINKNDNATFSNHTINLYKKYLSFTRKPCNTSSCTCNHYGHRKFYLKDGACAAIYYGEANQCTTFPGETACSWSVNVLGGVYFDVNGEEEPNMIGKDQFMVPLNADGIFYD